MLTVLKLMMILVLNSGALANTEMNSPRNENPNSSPIHQYEVPNSPQPALVRNQELRKIIDLITIHSNRLLKTQEWLDIQKESNLKNRQLVTEHFLSHFDLVKGHTYNYFGYSLFKYGFASDGNLISRDNKYWLSFMGSVDRKSPFIHTEKSYYWPPASVFLPLKSERDMFVVVSSNGPAHKPPVPGLYTVSGGVVVAIGIRLDPFDRPDLLGTESLIRFAATIGEDTSQQLNERVFAEFNKFPQFDDVRARFHAKYFDRVAYNILVRDLRSEFLNYIQTAAALAEYKWVDNALIRGSTGLLISQSGDTYLVQTLSFNDELLDQDKEFIFQLAQPSLSILKQYQMTNNPEASKRALKNLAALKAERARLDCNKILKKFGSKNNLNR